LRNLSCVTQFAPGIGPGNAYRFRVSQNGTDTQLFCEINDAERTCSSATQGVPAVNSLVIAPGDRIVLEITLIGSPGASGNSSCTVEDSL
jgi:hypothetical protein